MLGEYVADRTDVDITVPEDEFVKLGENIKLPGTTVELTANTLTKVTVGDPADANLVGHMAYLEEYNVPVRVGYKFLAGHGENAQTVALYQIKRISIL